MALQLTSVITDGVRRALTRTGGILFVCLLATQLLLVTSLNSLLAATAPPEVTDQIGLTLPVSQTVAGGLLLGTYGVTVVYFVVAARALARPLADLSTFPSTLYTRRMGRATLSMFIGSVFIAVAVLVGFAFLIVPGLVLAACFLCYIFTVGVEDCGTIAGLTRSWALSRGNRLRLVAFVVLVGITGGLVGVIPTLFDAAGARLVADLLTILTNSLVFVPVYGMMAAVYLQLSSATNTDGQSGELPSSSSTPQVSSH